MKVYYFIKTAIFILALNLMLISCDTENNIPIKQTQGDIKIHNIDLDPNGSYTMDDVVNSYDTTDIMGFIICSNDYERVFFWDSTGALINIHKNKAQSYFFNPNNPDTMYECSGISINDTSLRNIDLNDPYTYVSFGDQDIKDGVYFNFNGSNEIDITGNQFIPSIDTSITFGLPVRFLNINRGDTIYTSSALNISWTGESNGFAQIVITKVDSLGTYGDLTYIGNAIVDNDGSFTITSGIMNTFPDGIYEIIIYKFEPYFLLLDNGYNVVLNVKTSHKVTVYLI